MKCAVKRCHNEAEVHVITPDIGEYDLCRECFEREDEVVPGSGQLIKYWQHNTKHRPLEIVAR